MKKVKGNLIRMAKNGDFNVVIHGCNCWCAMGAGFAKQVKDEFPEAYEADCKTAKGDYTKLGTYSSAMYHITGTTTPFQKLWIVNGYTQNNYARGLINVDYSAVDRLFAAVKRDFGGKGLKIAYPQIGCGLAGGDWNVVSEIIERNLEGEDHTYVEYDPRA